MTEETWKQNAVREDEIIVELELERLRSFKNHPFKDYPFKVVDDEKMQDLVESIRANSVLSPVLIRPAEHGTYEMISGHRRMHAAQQAGLDTVPAIIRELTDDEATVAMVDANIQREELLPSEKAWAYKMKMDAMRRQGSRNDLTSCQIGTKLRTDIIIGEQVGESARSVQRYIRLTELIPDLLDYVDLKKIQFTVAVDISYIDKEIQKWLFEYIKHNGAVKANQIALLRTELQSGAMTQEKMIDILNGSQPGKTPTGKLAFSEKKQVPKPTPLEVPELALLRNKTNVNHTDRSDISSNPILSADHDEMRSFIKEMVSSLSTVEVRSGVFRSQGTALPSQYFLTVFFEIPIVLAMCR